MNWQKVRFGDAIENFDRKRIPLSTTQRESRRGIYPYYGANGVIDYVDDYIFDGNYLLLAEDGNTVVNSDGYPTVHRADGKFWVNNHAHVFKSAEGIDQRFLFYVLKKTNFRSVVTGAAQPKINQENMNGVMLSVPELPIQSKIADVLGAYDDLIENNRRRIALLEKMSRELYRERFVRRYEKTGNVVRLGDVCSCLLGGTPSRNKIEYWNGDVAWINSGKVNELRIVEPSEYITEEGLKCSAAKLLPRKTTVLAITGATLGQVSLLEIESAANQSVIGVVQNDRLPYTFIYPLICENIADLIALQTGGAQQHINKDNVESMEFDLPNEIDVGNYHKIAAPMYDEMAALLFCNINLARQRDRLLPRLMSGKIDLDKLVKGAEVENG